MEKKLSKNSNSAEQKGNNRRDLLKMLGVGGLTLALGGMMPLSAFAIEGTVEASSNVRQVPNVASLLSVKTSELKNGDKFIVGGYYADGDGGAKIVRWVADSDKADNGGTVHNPFGTNMQNGRFEVVHNGVGDYRWFGIFDETKAADEAMKAMVNDPTILRIEAHSNLLFNKRNRLTRSNITLNFNGFTVYTYGMETGAKDDPFGAVFFFTGETYGKNTVYTLKNDMPEYWDTFEVEDSSKFTIGDWYVAIVDNLPEGREQKELQKMMQVIEVVDPTHVRFDYKLGWPLNKGRVITYTPVKPVTDVRIENMKFEGNGRPTTTDGGSGSNPIAFEYAVRCDVFNVHAVQVFWPMIMRRYNSYYQTNKCSLYNPVEVQVGGTGYMTQQIHCTYGSVRDCLANKTRHLNDFTNSAYCEVENCHAIGDNMGPYVTHGQFEHDLTYIGNSGLLSFANSGITWGSAAKNITVKKHIGTRVIAENRITNLTLEDIHTFYQDGISNAGSIWANVDGLVMRNCHAEKHLSMSQKSNWTTRPNIIDGCSFFAVKGYFFGRGETNIITQQVTFRNCEFKNLDNNYYAGTGPVDFENCLFEGAAEGAIPLVVSSDRIRLTNCRFKNVGIGLNGSNAQELKIDGGTVFEGVNNADWSFVDIGNRGDYVDLDIGNMTFQPADAASLFIRFREGAKLRRMKMIGATLIGGKSEIGSGVLTDDGFIYITNCIEQGYNKGTMPPETSKVRYNTGNLTI